MAKLDSFGGRLSSYKKAIEADIAVYAEYLRKSTREHYGEYAAELEIDVFLDVLERGGKRIRGALVICGYEMCGGTNAKMIVQAARAIEMLHAYILIVDDIQDRSKLRRGRPSAHELVAEYHRSHNLRGDAAHTGMSLAMMAGIAGGHAAQQVLANLDADPQLRINVLSITNRTLMITAHGQTTDIMNELVDSPTLADIERVLECKTALYTVTNPLHVGMVLAGAGCESTDAITPYGFHAGKAFQIVDDILGIYGDEAKLGKTPGDDVREGKGTLLMYYALQQASPADKVFLRHCLGNQDVTFNEFVRVRDIIQNTGALANARETASEHLDDALLSLDANKHLWRSENVAFLRSLAVALQDRVY